MKKISLLFAFFAFTLIACQDKYPDLEDGIYAEFVTSKGTFVAKLFHDQAPITVSSFVDLAEGTNTMADTTYKGKPFYNGLKFHRVIKDFMIQGGDPLGNGTGGPGYKFPDEIVPELQHNKKGILSMANSGPATNGSQFFVTLKETPHLDGMHTVFGEVVIGMEVVDSIGTVSVNQESMPTEDVVIKEVNIIRKGNVELNSFEKEMEEIEKERKAKEERMANIKAESAATFASQMTTAEVLPSGLKMLYLEKGDGPQPKEGDKVLVNYEGYLTDGTLFDSSILEVVKKYDMVDPRREAAGGYTPMPAVYSTSAQLIAGFKEGLLKMKVGDKAILFIPSHLGYGESGAGNVIPPNSDLVFVLEIVEIMN